MPKGKKVLFKIPSEEELKKDKTQPKKEAVKEEIPADLPVVEPKPVATNLSKPQPNPPPKKKEPPKPEAKKPEPKKEEKILFRRPDEKKIKDAGPGPDPGEMGKTRDERRAARQERRRERLAKQRQLDVSSIDGISVGNREERKKAKKEARRDARERMKKLEKLSINLVEGITVGSPTQAQPKNARRITRDRRREALQNRRDSMKVIINGEEKKVSETSKYILDMLIQDE